MVHQHLSRYAKVVPDQRQAVSYSKDSLFGVYTKYRWLSPGCQIKFLSSNDMLRVKQRTICSRTILPLLLLVTEPVKTDRYDYVALV